MCLTLNREGFITNYLLSGPAVEGFTDTTGKRDDNQLRYEAYLRSILPRKEIPCVKRPIRLGEAGPEAGSRWSYYFSYGDWFVDVSTFYSMLTRVELSAATVLCAEENMDAEAVLWSYAAVRVWCNGELAGEIKTPVYKPIAKRTLSFHLKKGENLIYIKLQNLGVRDTRTIFGIQLTKDRNKLSVTLPDIEHVTPYIEREQFLSGIRKEKDMLLFDVPAPDNTSIAFLNPVGSGNEKTVIALDGKKEVILPSGAAHAAIICRKDGINLERRLEFFERIKPAWHKEPLSPEENRREIYRLIAEQDGSVREGELFGMVNVLARKNLGLERPDDMENIRRCLIPVRKSFDCSDFTVSALLRYLMSYPADVTKDSDNKLNGELAQEIKYTLTHFRYWMDQKGSDGMCFWSENHTLLFYSSMMIAGKLYPNETFSASGLKGTALYEEGKKKVAQWLACAEQYGFEEFLSSCYMCVTFAALLNVIDYGEESLSYKAARVADKLLSMLAVQTFHGTIFAPMGRVYRSVLFPFLQPTQTLMNLFNPDIPYVASGTDGWPVFFAASSYRPPENLASLMETECSREYSTGNALIKLEKRADYCLTSVQSGREDAYTRWENLTLNENADTSTHEYTRSLNERFHGTTCFEPGVYGYQQHMWYGAVDTDTFVFTSHPGGTCDASGMRPGYWYGCGVIPALKQTGNRLGIIYEIPEEHPIHFTHLFFPEERFDWSVKKDGWIFGGKGNGLIGVWCSEAAEPFADQLFNCELRAYGDKTAYFCICAGLRDYGDSETFMESCIRMNPVYDKENGILTASEDFSMKFEKAEDKTQYI